MGATRLRCPVLPERISPRCDATRLAMSRQQQLTVATRNACRSVSRLAQAYPTASLQKRLTVATRMPATPRLDTTLRTLSYPCATLLNNSDLRSPLEMPATADLGLPCRAQTRLVPPNPVAAHRINSALRAPIESLPGFAQPLRTPPLHSSSRQKRLTGANRMPAIVRPTLPRQDVTRRVDSQQKRLTGANRNACGILP